jgi:membrane-associated phospholipid phosphatase
VKNRDALFLQHLPADTFPSDHAAMAAAIATVTLLWGFKNKDKTFIMMSLPLILFAIVM